MKNYLMLLILSSIIAILADGSGSSRRILNGEHAKMGEIPFAVLIDDSNFNDHKRCGGVIITIVAVLTTANCIKSLNPKELTVRAGSTYRDGGIVRKVEMPIVHENFSETTLDNNIAVLILNKKFEFSNTIDKLQLPNMKMDLKTHDSATIYGWGVDEYSDYPDSLKKGDTIVIDSTSCNHQNQVRLPLTPRMFCASSLGEHFSTACFGDAGGALVKYQYVYGLSYGKSAKSGKSGECTSDTVYTRITALHEWIIEKLAQHGRQVERRLRGSP